MRSAALVLVLVVVIVPGGRAPAQGVARPDEATRAALREIVPALGRAMAAGDEAEVARLARRGREALGDQAGLPEVADESRPIPPGATPLRPDELAGAFTPYLDHLERTRWWRVGLDPARTNHAPRELASVIEGCLAARTVPGAQGDRALALARSAGDVLVWAQEQAGTGVFPFPAVRDGTGRPFEVAERFFRKAERDGVLDRVVRGGWVVDDLGGGDLQFDNGLAGVALLHLFEASGEPRYRAAALRGADWAIGRPVVANWNYNSFTVHLLAEASRVTGARRYLDAATARARLGVLPGQIPDGPRAGRWADPHNARPAYHYIMLRSLAALAAVLPGDDPARPAVVAALGRGLRARNPDFARGVVNADSAVEALAAVERLPPATAAELGATGTAAALDAIERYAASAFRDGRPNLGPGPWGALLALRARARGPAPPAAAL
jgi:hypothetical protein